MSDIPRSAELVTAILKDTPGLLDLVQRNPAALDNIQAAVTKHLPPPVFLGDKAIYRTVVVALASVAVVAVLGALLLTAFFHEVPDMVTALGSAAIGALAGLLAPSPTSRSGA